MSFVPQIDALRAAADAVEDQKLLSGRAVARALRGEARRAVGLLAEHGVRPHLAVVLIGDNPASQIYVRMKFKACEEVGIVGVQHLLPASTTKAELHALLDELSAAPEVYGILLQLPIPEHLEPMEAIEHITPERDVDGFHASNLGQLMAWRGALEPCTPRGVMTMLDAYRVPIRGKRAVVVGRSMVVGRPMAQMLVRADATVTICHRHTRDLEGLVREAELLVVATGVPGLIRGEWVAEGAVVVDVGISRLPDGRVVGDVDFESAYPRAGRISPVPGGVGPMTVATLMENTIRAACVRHGLHIDASGIRPIETGDANV